MILDERYREFLISALYTAITGRQKVEKEVLGYTMDSALVATWKQIRKELEAGK